MRSLVMPNVAAIWVILGGQWPTKPSYDPKVPWAQPDAERAKKVRLALNLAIDKKAIIERVLGGVGTAVGTVNYYPTDPWISDALLRPIAYDPAEGEGPARRGRLSRGLRDHDEPDGVARPRVPARRGRGGGDVLGEGRAEGEAAAGRPRGVRRGLPQALVRGRGPRVRGPPSSPPSRGSCSRASPTRRPPCTCSSSIRSWTRTSTGWPSSRARRSGRGSCARRWGPGSTSTCRPSPSPRPTRSPASGRRSASGR